MKIQKNILISLDITSEEGRRLEKNEKPEKNEFKKKTKRVNKKISQKI